MALCWCCLDTPPDEIAAKRCVSGGRAQTSAYAPDVEVAHVVRTIPTSREDELASAVLACEFAADRSNVLIERQRKGIIDQSLWLMSERTPSLKYSTRYCSVAAYEFRSDVKRLAHEHVWTRRRMIQAILAHPDRSRDILTNAIGCTVLREEHERLNQVPKDVDGWQRYLAAEIDVYDLGLGGVGQPIAADLRALSLAWTLPTN